MDDGADSAMEWSTALSAARSVSPGDDAIWTPPTLTTTAVTHGPDNDGVNTTSETDDVSFIYITDANYTSHVDPVMKATWLIHRHYLKVLCAVGLPGNVAALLAVAVMVRPLTANTFLLALLAVSDSLALLFKLPIIQLHYSLDSVSDHYCRALPLTNVCSSYANWVLVLVAVERLVAVTLPFSRERCFSKRRVVALCGALAVFILAVHLPLIIGGVAVRRFQCGTVEEVSDYALSVWPWVNVTLYAFLPVVLLLLITLLLLTALRKAGRRRHLLHGSVRSYMTSGASQEARRTERTFTVMTLAAAVLFVLMVLPQCLYYILFHYTAVLEELRYTPTDLLTQQVTTVLADATHALNFYFYIISAKRFRRHLALCLRVGCRRSLRRSSSSPAANSVSKLSGRELVSAGHSTSGDRMLRTHNGSSRTPQMGDSRTPHVANKDSPQNAGYSSPQNGSSGSQHNGSNTSPQNSSNRIPQTTSNRSPQNTSNGIPQNDSNKSPQNTINGSPQNDSNRSSQNGGNRSPHNTSNRSLQNGGNRSPHNTSNRSRPQNTSSRGPPQNTSNSSPHSDTKRTGLKTTQLAEHSAVDRESLV